MHTRLLIYLAISILTSCSNDVIEMRNEKMKRLKATVMLRISEEKKFVLDDNSAPKPQYIQLFEKPGKLRYFTFLNEYNNSIYIYDYLTGNFVRKITFNKKGNDAIQIMTGYCIKSLDSIYIYDKYLNQVIISNENTKVLKRISLKGDGNDKKWFLKYPQYLPKTVSPFIETPKELLLTGFYVTSIPESVIHSFKFTARIDLKTQQVRFSFLYPAEIFGSGYNWPGWGFTQAFTEIHPNGNKVIFSFPVSHDLYIADLNSENYKKVYAGSNFACTIRSLECNPERTTEKKRTIHFAKQDTYAAIKYDKYRNVYYRFLLNGIPNATVRTNWREKPVTIIVMDKDFNYLGETTIGNGDKEWCWQNSFVTKEGLNVEYIEKDTEETYLTLKIFTLKEI